MIDSSTTGADADFWRQQQTRHQRLGQPCCTQSNISWSLIDMVGNFCVVIHGESDCLNCFFHHLGRSAVHFYCTRLTERQLIAGQTGAPLRRLLELLVAERAPEVVIVLGTCPVEVIGDPFEAEVEAVSNETGVPMIALRTHGLGLVGMAETQDWLHASLAGLRQLDARASAGINLIGAPPGPEAAEAEEVLDALGLQLNASYPRDASLASWRRIGQATHSFIVDRQMFPRLVRRLEQHDQQVVDVPLPMGPDQTDRFYRSIATSCGLGAAIDPIIESLARPYRDELAALAGRFRGRRLALCIRMLKTHRVDLLACDGLSDLVFLQSAGFDVEILVQGPPEQSARDIFAQRLVELGYGGMVFDIFEGPWMLGEKLRQGRFDVAVISDVARNVVEDAGIPMIPTGSLRPFYAGRRANLELLERVGDGWT